MLVIVNTDRNIRVDADKEIRIQEEVANAVARFADHLTRVEVYLTDESAGRSTTDDIRCRLEARPAGQDAVAVSHQAMTDREALGGALDKLEALLTSKFDRLTDKERHATIRGH